MKLKSLFSAVAACLLVTWIVAPSASFAVYPDRPIQLTIPYAAGTMSDISARLLAAEMEKTLRAKIVVINKPGGGNTIGVEAVVRGKRDGYNLLYSGGGALVYAPNANPEAVHYDPVKDLEPLGFHLFAPTVFAIKPGGPWKNFRELTDYARKNPGKIRVATTGVGAATHFTLEVLQSITGTQFTMVPVGGENTVTSVMGGHVEATLDGMGKLKPHHDAGKMKVILVDPKLSAYPEIPCLQDLGYKEPLTTTWFAMWAPAGIPQEARAALVPAVEKAVKATKPKIDEMGNVGVYKSPAELKRFRDEEYKLVYELAVKLGLRKP